MSTSRAAVPWTPGEEPSRVGTTTAFAVATLVTGVFGLVPLAVVFGVIAVLRIRKYEQRGFVLTVIGLVLSPLAAAGAAFGVMTAYPWYQQVTDAVPQEGEHHLEQLDPGTCVNGRDGELAVVGTPVDCAQPHDGEVFHLEDFPGDDFPGEKELSATTDERCIAAFADYVGIPFEQSRYDLWILGPSPATWARGDRTIVCTVIPVPEAPRLVGSVRDSRQ